MLFATDALGQKGRSAVETFLLPERVFNDPTARALIVLRKALTRDPKVFRLDVADGMRLIQVKPESYRNDAVVQLGLRIGAARLATNGDKPTITDTQKLLWDLAMRLENGSQTDAERALEQARQELRDAMQRNAGDEEIERLIQQLYDAMAKWQKELAEKMQDPEERRRMQEQAEKMDPNNTITGDDLQKMLDKIREMAKNGQREEAKRLLEELRKMMENATPMMAQPGQQRQQGQRGQQGQGNQQGREMMNQLDRLSRRQNQLLGESEREGRQQQGRQGQQGQRQQGQVLRDLHGSSIGASGTGGRPGACLVNTGTSPAGRGPSLDVPACRAASSAYRWRFCGIHQSRMFTILLRASVTTPCGRGPRPDRSSDQYRKVMGWSWCSTWAYWAQIPFACVPSVARSPCSISASARGLQ